MNKYQEALDRIMNDDYDFPNDYYGEDRATAMERDEETLQELVEIATPKKAILVHDYDGLVFECPNCHMEFRPDTIMNHVKWKGCPYCLQNLDWSDEE